MTEHDIELHGLNLIVECETDDIIVGDEVKGKYLSPQRVYVVDDTNIFYELPDVYLKNNHERIVELLNEE